VIAKTTLVRLLGGMVLLPIAIVLLEGLSALLGAMQDAAGAAVLGRIALGLGVLWAFLAVALLLAVAANAALAADKPEADGPEEH
jgi:hypothetical protein